MDKFKWFALVASEDLAIVPLGEFGEYQDADAVAPENSIWVMNKEEINQLKTQMNAIV